MTIFDSLRYPINGAPTAEILLALPEDLFIEWKSKTMWKNPRYHQSAEDISSYYFDIMSVDDLSGVEKEEIALLKKMIAEYDNI